MLDPETIREHTGVANDIGTLISSGKDIKSADLTNGIVDYSLKCINGAHKNRFIYINLTPEGEIIGNDLANPQVTLAVDT